MLPFSPCWIFLIPETSSRKGEKALVRQQMPSIQATADIGLQDKSRVIMGNARASVWRAMLSVRCHYRAMTHLGNLVGSLRRKVSSVVSMVASTSGEIA